MLIEKNNIDKLFKRPTDDVNKKKKTPKIFLVFVTGMQWNNNKQQKLFNMSYK